MRMFQSRFAGPAAASALLLAAGCTPVAPPAAQRIVPELAGRTAGAPQRCTLILRSEGLRPIDRDTIVYGRGATVYVNELGPRCAGFPPGHILVVEPIGAQHCRGDRVRSIDPVSRIPGPACILGDFVPYRR